MNQQNPQDTTKAQYASEVWHKYLNEGVEIRSMGLPWFEHRMLKPVFRNLPSDPRCQICYIPFSGIGGSISRILLDVRPSSLSPHICNVCERFARRFPGGTEIEVSILFADIRGSTSLAEKMETRAFSELIQSFYFAGTKSLYAHYGLIEKFAGDGLSAFFAPALAGNHALSAIKAAKDILRRTGHAEGKKPWVPVGVGVHTGIAFVGSVMVETDRAEITILGDAANVAARLGSESAAGELLVSERALALSGLSSVDLQYRLLSLKGKADQVKVWSL